MVKLNKSTRYALCAAMEMAEAWPDAPVTVARVADRYGIPQAVLAKVFQQLVHGGIATSSRGPGGGYRLTRDPSRVTVLEVMEIFEGTAPATRPRDAEPMASFRGPGDRGLKRLLNEVDELSRATFASISLKTLIRQPAGPVGSVTKAD